MRARWSVFVDTSGWYALTADRDVNHTVAARRFRRATERGRTVITTNHVVGESYTLLLRRLGPRAAHAFLQHMRTSSLVQRTFVPESWEEEAAQLLEHYADQPFSYVDATSFVTMRLLGIREALAFDRDFFIAGFTSIGDE